jgi:hypothetical protein
MVSKHSYGIPDASKILAEGTEKDDSYFLRVEPVLNLIGGDPAVIFKEIGNERVTGNSLTLKSLTHKEEMITSGLRSCPGLWCADHRAPGPSGH